MTQEEIQLIADMVAMTLKKDSVTIEQLQPTNVLAGTDLLELDKGRNVSLEDLRKFVRGTGIFLEMITSKDKTTVPSDSNVFSALRTLREIANSVENMKDIFLRKDQPDATEFLLTMFAGAEFGHHKKGVSGAAVDKNGNIDAMSLMTHQLSSFDFVSGFPNGIGYMLAPYERENAAGVKEKKYKLELDALTVRGPFRVFEMIYSQLRGENDNVVFSGMMKVDHIDTETSTIYLDTEEGLLYNPFHDGDILMVQRIEGIPSPENDYKVVRQYEFRVVEAKVGNLADKEKRLDTLRYTSFVGSTDDVKKGDVVTRADSLTDSTRKGIIKVTTIDEFGAPYIDVIYGMKTDPQNATKVRLGRLDGLVTPDWGRLNGYGLYASNAYLKGTFMLRNGDDVQTRFDITDGKIESEVSSMRTEFNERDNYLSNASFARDTYKWEAQNDILLFTVAEKFLYMNDNFYSEKKNIAAVISDGGRKVLRLLHSTIVQRNANLAKRPDKKITVVDESASEPVTKKVWPTFYVSFMYKCTRSGQLTVGFEGQELNHTVMVEESSEYLRMDVSGKWDGTGDFRVGFTGDIYIYSMYLANNPLEDIKMEYDTRFYQTDKRIGLYAEKVDGLEGTVTQLGIDINAEKEQVNLYIQKTDELQNSVTNLGVQINGYDESVKLYAQKLEQTNTSLSELKVSVDGISSTVTSVQGDADEARRIADAAQSAADSAASDASTAYGLADRAWDKADDAQTQAASALTQSSEAVTILAGNFDKQGNVLSSSNLVVKADLAELKTTMKDEFGNDITARLAAYVKFNQETGVVESDIKLQADNILLDGYTNINNNVQIGDNKTGIGRFVITDNKISWQLANYFNEVSRTIKIGYNDAGSPDYEGMIDVKFDASTKGRVGIMTLGSAPGSAALYASTGGLLTTGSSMTYSGFFVGAVDVRDTQNGLISDVCASMEFRAITGRNANGTYRYRKGVTFGIEHDLDSVRLEVKNGIIVGLYRDNGSQIVVG